MKYNFIFADLHCHPSLKTFGHSFENNKYGLKRSSIWFQQKCGFFKKWIHRYTGLTKFSQADFTSLKSGNVKIVTVSLYPFEKGFFINACKYRPLSAFLANIITGIGFHRIRNIQKSIDYFDDLEKEYQFMLKAIVSESREELSLLKTKEDLETVKKGMSVIVFAIEGAHVFNSGLKKYGRPLNPKEITSNIRKVKNWEVPPKTITFAHNFGNDLCGHARSLEPLGRLVNQNEMLNEGFTALGFKALKALLDTKHGAVIYPDIKHMSLSARKDYYRYLKSNFKEYTVPIIVSHGAVTGTSWHMETSIESDFFCIDDINFYDEELIKIAKSKGLFALQLDGRRLVQKKVFKNLNRQKNKPLASATVIWKHMAHIAIVLDENDLPSWNTICIGSDFDGTTTPLPGIYTAADLPVLAENLIELATAFLQKHQFKNDFNKLAAQQIVNQFCYHNIYNFYFNTI